MKRLTKPAALLLYLLSIVVFLLMGFTFAGVTNAAEGQGLAGGAIVLSYGLLFAFVALIGAFFFAYYAKYEKIILANRILAIVFGIALILLVYKVKYSH